MARARWKKNHKGLELRSGLEKKVATYLDQKKVKYEYEKQVIKYTVPESQHRYTPDFVLPNGIIIECKGRFTPADRKKMSLVIEQHPELDIRMLFMLDNTLSKSSKTTYSMWCEKRGIKYAVSKTGVIPKEWLKNTKSPRTEQSKGDNNND